MTDNDILNYFYYKYGNKLRLSTKNLLIFQIFMFLI